MGKLIATGSEWTFEHIQALDRACAAHAARYGLEYYPNQLEVITSEQMLDAYSAVGLPVNYHHWSFGKDFLANEKAYQQGQQGLAYEIVINSNPCISYLMEGNSLAMQALVIAHACYGHNSFFRGNYLFRQWTQPDAIVDYMMFARTFIAECEERYGYERVEATLDALHALREHGVDKYKRPGRLDSAKERQEQAKRLAAAREVMRQNEYASLLPREEAVQQEKTIPEQPEENLLYFLEKHAPKLEPWQRELARIVRKIAQYFYPQRQTKVMNEGWATFWHHRLLYDMYDADEIDDGILLECMHSHTNVIAQRPFAPFNPYALGFAMFTDIKRMCEKPTDEDRRYFPQLAGADWLGTLKDAMGNFRDESFVLQFLSPRLVREMRMMHMQTFAAEDSWQVCDTASDEGFERVRERLSESFRLESWLPEISVVAYRRDTDRSLLLRHRAWRGKTLDKASAEKTVRHLRALWGYGVTLESVDDNGRVLERFVDA